MKISLDISRLNPDALRRGVGYYTQNLFKSFKELKNNNTYLLRENIKDSQQPDLLHFPYFDPFFLTLPIIRSKPTIVTIHDLIPLKFPNHYPAGIKGKIKWYMQKLLVSKVQAIITDSVSSKKDIMEIINYPQEKIYSIYLAAGEEFRQLAIGSLPDRQAGWQLAIKEKYQLPDIFLLYVGDVNWNKNIQGLIKAFYKLKTQNLKLKTTTKNLKLILIGEAFKNDNLKEKQEINQIVKDLKMETEIIYLGFVLREDLVAVYNLATLYIQPSFYEGFGLPVLEAMSCGCPILSSNQGSLPEVGGQAVEYFSPYLKNDLEAKLISLLNNNQKLEALKKLGLARAKKFSWQKTALETRKIYEKVLEGN